MEKGSLEDSRKKKKGGIRKGTQPSINMEQSAMGKIERRKRNESPEAKKGKRSPSRKGGIVGIARSATCAP